MKGSYLKVQVLTNQSWYIVAIDFSQIETEVRLALDLECLWVWGILKWIFAQPAMFQMLTRTYSKEDALKPLRSASYTHTPLRHTHTSATLSFQVRTEYFNLQPALPVLVSQGKVVKSINYMKPWAWPVVMRGALQYSYYQKDHALCTSYHRRLWRPARRVL